MQNLSTSLVDYTSHTKSDRSSEPAHKFEVDLGPDDFTEEKFELYKNYQHNVHHDSLSSISPTGFRRFLCDSPLIGKNDGEKKLGSFHQCYRLGGRLIAMAVLDLLPHCVSGVYFVYHSDFEQWSFGKISAMREATLALEAGYQYYYMGYYIHSCAKMLYKNDYKPQTFLDLESWTWNPLDDQSRKLLDEHHYLSPSLLDRKESEGQSSDLKGKDERRAFDSAIAVCDAIDGGLSLFEVDFPGMMSESELNEHVDLNKILLQIRPVVVVHAEVSRQPPTIIKRGIY
jgi:arginine-tRNA-protein transferase